MNPKSKTGVNTNRAMQTGGLAPRTHMAAPAKAAAPKAPAPKAPAPKAPAPKAQAPAPKAPAAKTAAKGPVPKDRASQPIPAPKRKTMTVTAPVHKEVELDEEETSEIDMSEARAEAEEREAIEAEAEPVDEFEESAEEPEAEAEQTEEAVEEEQAEEATEETSAYEPEASEEVEAEVEPAPAPKKQKPMPQVTKPAPSRYAPKPEDKAVAARKHGQLALAQPAAQKSSALQGDVILPRVLLLQSTSELVKARKGYAGQIVSSPEGKLLGGINQPGEPANPVNVIPLAITNTWTIGPAEGFGFIRTEPRTEENDNLPWDFYDELTSQDAKRVKTIELIALLADDVVASATGAVEVDEDGIPLDLDQVVVMPKVFSFRSKSMTAGKGVATFFRKVEAARASHPATRPFHFMLPIGCTEESNEYGDFFSFDVGGTQKAPKETREVAESWFNTVTSGNVQIQDENEAQAAAGENLEARPAPKKGRNLA